MNNLSISLFYIVILIALSATATAESLRCKTKLAHIGDTKAEVLEKCGSPEMTDNFCQPVAIPNPPQGIQNGNNNVQNNISIASCESVDIWSYNPGKGKFMAHLYFARGELQRIRYGDRVK